MAPNISDLIAALPDDTDAGTLPNELSQDPLARLSRQLPPLGQFARLRALGSLQGKIAAAYLFHWLRGWFKTAAANERLLAETHWRTAVRLLDSMSYLRGAVMKVGQTLANFPDIAPHEFVETLERLHFDAPPMHWSLLREMVYRELGDDPENIFAEFDTQAFAAASLGQVHRARLKTGEEVAVKIQYPGIARTIETDFQNLVLFMFPSRLARDWQSTREQVEEFRQRLLLETDYELEAENLRKARALFQSDEGIVVPRVFDELSTSRVLTMEHLPGIHIGEFIKRGPSQQARNEVARKILKSWYRILYAGRMFYGDLHSGNYLVQSNGDLGLLDFGCVMPVEGEDWEMFRALDRPMTTGDPIERMAAVKYWNDVRDDEGDRLRLLDEFGECFWKSRYCGGEFDFADEADFRRCFDVFRRIVQKQYTRGHRTNMLFCRCNFAWRSLYYQLKAKIDISAIAEEEVVAAGWDRSEYAAIGRSSGVDH